MDTSYFNSPIGWMEIKTTNDVLTGLHFIDSPKNKQSPLKKINLEIEVQLENYFKHKPIKFNFSIAPQPFGGIGNKPVCVCAIFIVEFLRHCLFQIHY